MNREEKIEKYKEIIQEQINLVWKKGRTPLKKEIRDGGPMFFTIYTPTSTLTSS